MRGCITFENSVSNQYIPIILTPHTDGTKEKKRKMSDEKTVAVYE